VTETMPKCVKKKGHPNKQSPRALPEYGRGQALLGGKKKAVGSNYGEKKAGLTKAVLTSGPSEEKEWIKGHKTIVTNTSNSQISK